MTLHGLPSSNVAARGRASAWVDMGARAVRRWASRAAVLALMITSVVVRAHNLASPLDGEHAFRQTQTAITVWAMVDGGVRWMDYQTPLFGPPWQVPFEFPIYQAAAAGLARAGLDNIDTACRVTNLCFFYLSAAYLYLLCLQHFEARAAGVCIVMAYVWMPFTQYWSRTAMIDYASVAFTLAYLYHLQSWLRRQGTVLALPMAATFGSLSLLTKPTTTPIVAVAIGWAVLQRLSREFRTRTTGRDGLRRFGTLALGLAVAGGLPLVATAQWTAYTDAIKGASPATRWLVSGGLGPWIYGTWEQKLNWELWRNLLLRMWGPFCPGNFLVLPAFGVVWALFYRRAGRDLALTMLLGAVLTVVTFFNLHSAHSYYQMSLTPAAAILIGAGVYALCIESVQYRAAHWIIPLLLLEALYAASQGYIAGPFGFSYETSATYRQAAALRDATTPADLVIIEGRDWSADLLYNARRKGLMWTGGLERMDPKEAAPWVKAGGFTTVMSPVDPPMTAKFWNHYREVGAAEGFRIYKVWD